MNLHQWAVRHHVSMQALEELRAVFRMDLPRPVVDGVALSASSEAAVQVRVRLEAARLGARLFRNNVGVLMDETGRPVRYGLANESKAVNEKIKSADLIGVRPVVITPLHVGQTFGLFVSREVKAAGWRYSGTDREVAQLAWAKMINSCGGDACFVTGEGSFT
jgi:hypothetical protein